MQRHARRGLAFTAFTIVFSLLAGSATLHATAYPLSVDVTGQEVCADANRDGRVTASDALVILKAAVGLGECALTVCDASGDARLTANDALMTLRFAVGMQIELQCDVNTTTTTSTTTTTLAQKSLTVSRTGSGSGTVTSNPAGIECGSDCNQPYNIGTSVTLTATAAAGSTFSGWSGACSGTDTCQVTMSTGRSVSARFDKIVTYTLQVSRSGTGTGTVTSIPDGIACGSDCSESCPTGLYVALAATAGEGSHFAGWSGACSGSAECVVAMTTSRSVTAAFDANVCPTAGPITDLRSDCHGLVYVYELDGLGEGLVTDGTTVLVVQSDGYDELAYSGHVTAQRTFTLTYASVNGGPFYAVLESGSAGNLSTDGRKLNLTIKVNGKTFTFTGAMWTATQPLTDAAADSDRAFGSHRCDRGPDEHPTAPAASVRANSTTIRRNIGCAVSANATKKKRH